MAALPYMQLYVAEYLADTAHLSTLEHGAYLLLLFNYWQRGKPLNSSDARLASVARMSNDQWLSVREVLSEFFTVTDTEWIHQRVERDLAKVSEKQGNASRAGKASAYKRGNSLFNERSTDDEPLITDTDTDTDTEQIKKHKKQEIPLPSGRELEVAGLKLEDYKSYMAVRKAKRQPFADERARDKWIAKWKKFYAAGYDTAAMFDQMISSGWVGEVEDKWKMRKREVHVLTQRELDEQNYRDFGSPDPSEWAPVDAPQGWVPCRN
jgi:uncharacterized protein YdaU (DUF1376 family)